MRTTIASAALAATLTAGAAAQELPSPSPLVAVMAAGGEVRAAVRSSREATIAPTQRSPLPMVSFEEALIVQEGKRVWRCGYGVMATAAETSVNRPICILLGSN